MNNKVSLNSFLCQSYIFDTFNYFEKLLHQTEMDAFFVVHTVERF